MDELAPAALASVMGGKQCRAERVLEIDPAQIQEIQIVAHGTFGTIFKAAWKDGLVAVKYAAKRHDLFLREIKIISRLDHPNVVKFYGARTERPGMFLVMEFATRGSVADRIYGKASGFYTRKQGFGWALQSAKGLQYLHTMKPHPIIHRDLKPANLLLFDNDNIVKIGDFGLALDRMPTVRFQSSRAGSLLYMAPEVRKRQKYSEKCDVYSWALLFWVILARKRPYGRNYQNEKPVLPEEWPRRIRAVIERSWDSTADRRPTMKEVVLELEGIVSESAEEIV